MVAENRTRILSSLEGSKSGACLARFWAKVEAGGPADCWLWTAGTGAGGYGSFKVARGVTATAHRFALVAKTWRDPIGLEAAHGPCANVLCCNPAHLRWATHQENQDDKRRVPHPFAKNARAHSTAQERMA